MTSHSVIPSRDLGLELGLLLANYLLDTEDLHYGLWQPGLPVKLNNLPQAQRAWTDLLLSRIPDTARDVLEVGCGTGGLALRLVERGCRVQCVAPDSSLLDRAEQRLGGRARIHRAFFEDFRADGQFDAIVFSESFQYVRMRESLALAKRLLRPGGNLVICDFFRRRGKPGSPIGGGHKWHEFEAAAAEAGLHIAQDDDITEGTAPTITLVHEFMERVGGPAWRLGLDYAAHKWPLRTRFSRWWFRKRIAKIESKYFAGRRTAAVFAEFKTYRLLRLTPTALVPVAEITRPQSVAQ